jgi:hypothetical protein
MINPTNNDGFEVADWCLVDSDKVEKSSSVESTLALAVTNLNYINTNIPKHASYYFGRAAALQQDAETISSQIELLETVNGIDPEERKKLIPQLCSVYKILDALRLNNYLDVNSKNQVVTHLDQIQSQCFNVAHELCQLHSLITTADKLCALSEPNDYLLDVQNQNNPSLVLMSQATNSQAANTYQFLQNTITYLNTPAIIVHLSVSDLIKLKTLVCWLAVNYLKSQKNRLDLSEHIYSQLLEINKILNQNLGNRDQNEYAQLGDITRLISLKTHLVGNHYFKDFWYQPVHVDELKEYQKYLKSCNQFLSDTDCVSLEGLTFIEKNDAAGIALYEVPQDEQSQTLVVFSYNKEGVSPYYNCFQARSSNLGVGGLGHQPVYDYTETCWEVLKEHLKNNKNIKHIITSGFGIDGAVAQLLGFLAARQYPNIQTRSYCMGVAPFVDVNAAATIKNQKNHYAINFKLNEDKLLSVSKYSAYVAKTYSKINFLGTFKLYNRDWFMSDFTGHDRKIYVEKAQPGVQQPIEIHELYSELDEISKIKSLTSTAKLPPAIHQHMQKFKKN